MSAKGPQRGDVVQVTATGIGQLGKVYPDVTALDMLTVTRVDRSRGRACLFVRKKGRDQALMVWPDQVRIIKRAVPSGPRGRR